MFRMLDLQTEAVTAWLQAMQPARSHADWPPPIRPVEQSAVGLFQQLSEVFGDSEKDSGVGLAAAAADPKIISSLRVVLAQLGAARMLRIVAALSDVFPAGTMARLQSELCDPNTAEGRAFAAALDAAAQTTLRGRLIAHHRLEALAAAVKDQPAQENL
jgi:hypothetical protein